MKNLSIKEKLQNITKGRFHHMVWKSEKQVNGDNYLKISSGSVRFANYYKVVGKPQPTDYEDTIIKVNKKGEEYVQVFTTGKAPKVQYYLNGKSISKEDYESAIPNNSAIGVMFSKHLSDILVLE